jgi:hypothetical protein
VVNMPPPSRGLQKVELLVAELKAIEFWDAAYWRGEQSQMLETLAYTARRERRAEILSQLHRLIPQLDNDDPKSQGAETGTDKRGRNV